MRDLFWRVWFFFCSLPECTAACVHGDFAEYPGAAVRFNATATRCAQIIPIVVVKRAMLRIKCEGLYLVATLVFEICVVFLWLCVIPPRSEMLNGSDKISIEGHAPSLAHARPNMDASSQKANACQIWMDFYFACDSVGP